MVQDKIDFLLKHCNEIYSEKQAVQLLILMKKHPQAEKDLLMAMRYAKSSEGFVTKIIFLLYCFFIALYALYASFYNQALDLVLTGAFSKAAFIMIVISLLVFISYRIMMALGADKELSLAYNRYQYDHYQYRISEFARMVKNA